MKDNGTGRGARCRWKLEPRSPARRGPARRNECVPFLSTAGKDPTFTRHHHGRAGSEVHSPSLGPRRIRRSLAIATAERDPTFTRNHRDREGSEVHSQSHGREGSEVHSPSPRTRRIRRSLAITATGKGTTSVVPLSNNDARLQPLRSCTTRVISWSSGLALRSAVRRRGSILGLSILL
jgi:hypothetical protein